MTFKVLLYLLLLLFANFRFILSITILLDISESDLIYTETLMARGKENYKDKEIVILGNFPLKKITTSNLIYQCVTSLFSLR